MSTPPPAERLALCSWSLQPEGPGDLIQKMKRIEIDRVQLALGPVAYDKPWKNAGRELADAGISIVSGMFGTKDEDYRTLETIRATGGVVPDATWEDNWKHIQRIIPLAESLGCGLVSFHAGFLPESPDDPGYDKLIGRLDRIAAAFAEADIELAFETGQEEAHALERFLAHLARPNVGVNFDPANMILYGKGDPVEGARVLLPHIKQIHVKDALPAKTPGTWGEEVVVGTGRVDWSAFFRTLISGGFNGYMSIEREAGDQRIDDIIAAKKHVLDTLNAL
ncbi:MAG: sugar phosphate isomerase/epimerase family protein [Planctomycetota bacterium]|jgi:sugar phosphate isomerase/epimerase